MCSVLEIGLAEAVNIEACPVRLSAHELKRKSVVSHVRMFRSPGLRVRVQIDRIENQELTAHRYRVFALQVEARWIVPVIAQAGAAGAEKASVSAPHATAENIPDHMVLEIRARARAFTDPLPRFLFLPTGSRATKPSDRRALRPLSPHSGISAAMLGR